MAKPKRTPPVAQPTPPQDARPAKAAAPTPAPFPIAHYLSRVPIQSAAVLFVLLQAANMNSPSKVTSVLAFIDVLVADPIPVLIVSVAGLGFVQAWFGTWARTTRRAALGLDKKKEVPVTEPAKEKTGFLGAFKSMGWNVLKGKPKQGIGRSAGAPKLDLNFNFLGPASLVTLAAALGLHAVAVLLGASLTTQVPETLLLCCVVAVLAIGPIAVAVEPTEQFVWLRLFSSMEPATDLEFALLAPAVGTLLGCWAGAIPIPLDWDRPWQAWPTTCVLGAVLGHTIGSAVSLGVCSYRAAMATEVAIEDAKSK